MALERFRISDFFHRDARREPAHATPVAVGQPVSGASFRQRPPWVESPHRRPARHVRSVNDARALRFAEKLLALLDSMNVSASYKFATLLALLDVVAESVNDAGEPPTTVSVGRRVVELYWPQSRTFGAGPDGVPKPLGQSAMRDIPEKLAEWRRQHHLDSLATLDDARSADPTGWALLEQELIGVVVGMPLAKLQRFGGGRTVLEDRFIYDFGWPDEVSHSVVARSRFDDRMTLRPGVGGWLISLAGLLRPVVEAQTSLGSRCVAVQAPHRVPTLDG